MKNVKSDDKGFKSRAPFGAQSRRFENVGLHPGLDKTGINKKNRLSPGEYDPKPYKCDYTSPLGSSWKRKTDLEEYSRELGFRNAAILKQRRYQKTLLGPGTYDVHDERHQCPTCTKTTSFGKGPRFREIKGCDYPPPGAYTTGINRMKERLRLKQFTSLPPFEWDGCVDRFRKTEKPFTLPPNLYTPKDPGSFQALLEKVVSKRGPYDLFTGPRDLSTIKNHFGKGSFKGPVNFFNVWPSEMEVMLRHPRNRGKGRFLQEPRFGLPTQRHMIDDPTQAKKDPNDPSPCTYDIEASGRTVKPNRYGFNLSTIYARPQFVWRILPGVGRYQPKEPVCSHPEKGSWVFTSKIGRPEHKAVTYSAF